MEMSFCIHSLGFWVLLCEHKLPVKEAWVLQTAQ